MNLSIDTNYYLELLVTDANGDPKTGLIASYVIYRSSDSVAIDSGSLSDIGDGTYSASYTFAALGQFYVLYTTPTGYSNEIENIFVENQTAQESTLLRVLGMTQSNFRMLDQVYDVNGDMTFARIKLYNSASDTTNDTSAFAEYEITVTYANRLVTNYESLKIS